MDTGFFAYLQQLEAMIFFSGYPLIYAIGVFIAETLPSENNFKRIILLILPFTYALVGTLYLGLQVKNLYPDYSIERLRQSIQLPWLIIWALLSVLFWIPAVGKKTILSFVHSLVFLFFILRDIFLQLAGSSVDKSVVRNDMKVYSYSLLINLAAFAFMALLSFLVTRFRKQFLS